MTAYGASKAPFRCENFWLLVTVALSFVFDKNCLIMDYLGLKDSSRQLQANCAISYSFYLYLMLHACAARFDVTKNLENFLFLVTGCLDVDSLIAPHTQKNPFGGSSRRAMPFGRTAKR